MKEPRLLAPLADFPGFDADGLFVNARGLAVVVLYDEVYDIDETTPAAVLVYNVNDLASDGAAVYVRRSDVMLNFADASTRDRAARWLATHKRIASSDSLDSACAPSFEPWGDRVWAIFKLSIGYVGDRYFGPSPLDRYGIDGGMVVPGLADLDHADVSRIDDGAYLRDVLALAVICRHVGSL